MRIAIISPSGCHLDLPRFDLACERLRALGHELQVLAPREPWQRFGGSDVQRLEQIHAAARSSADAVMITRGGYGLVRLIDEIDWPLIAQAVQRGQRWLGFSDFTVFQMALLAKTGAQSFVGPSVTEDFGREVCTPLTLASFQALMRGVTPLVQWQSDTPGLTRTDAAVQASLRGTLWGGNLATLTGLLGSEYFPDIHGGLLWLEDVGEHPYRIERLLHQLDKAGVLIRQKALLMGAFTGWKPVPNDHGYGWDALRDYWTQKLKTKADKLGLPTPLWIDGLPFGHTPEKLVMAQGRVYQLAIESAQIESTRTESTPMESTPTPTPTPVANAGMTVSLVPQ